MSRRNARRRQRAMNARRRAADPVRRRVWRDMRKALAVGIFLPTNEELMRQLRPPLRVIHADPDTFPWYDGFGAGPVFRRMDGSAIGPVEVAYEALTGGGHMVRWEVVEVRPGQQEVAATLIPESEWRKAPGP